MSKKSSSTIFNIKPSYLFVTTLLLGFLLIIITANNITFNVIAMIAVMAAKICVMAARWGSIFQVAFQLTASYRMSAIALTPVTLHPVWPARICAPALPLMAL